MPQLAPDAEKANARKLGLFDPPQLYMDTRLTTALAWTGEREQIPKRDAPETWGEPLHATPSRREIPVILRSLQPGEPTEGAVRTPQALSTLSIHGAPPPTYSLPQGRADRRQAQHTPKFSFLPPPQPKDCRHSRVLVPASLRTENEKVERAGI